MPPFKGASTCPWGLVPSRDGAIAPIGPHSRSPWMRSWDLGWTRPHRDRCRALWDVVRDRLAHALVYGTFCTPALVWVGPLPRPPSGGRRRSKRRPSAPSRDGRRRPRRGGGAVHRTLLNLEVLVERLQPLAVGDLGSFARAAPLLPVVNLFSRGLQLLVRLTHCLIVLICTMQGWAVTLMASSAIGDVIQSIRSSSLEITGASLCLFAFALACCWRENFVDRSQNCVNTPQDIATLEACVCLIILCECALFGGPAWVIIADHVSSTGLDSVPRPSLTTQFHRAAYTAGGIGWSNSLTLANSNILFGSGVLTVGVLHRLACGGLSRATSSCCSWSWGGHSSSLFSALSMPTSIPRSPLVGGPGTSTV